MSLKNIKTNLQSERGFTIVELLIVVVVIAILAAITIVSYNGITNRANASAAKSTAATVQKKAELYYAETSAYPTVAQLTGAASDKSYATPASTFTGSATPAPGDLGVPAPDANNGKNKVQYALCGTPVTGARITYWNYGEKLATSDGNTSSLTLGSGC